MKIPQKNIFLSSYVDVKAIVPEITTVLYNSNLHAKEGRSANMYRVRILTITGGSFLSLSCSPCKTKINLYFYDFLVK